MARSEQDFETELGAVQPFTRLGKRALRSLARAAREVRHRADHEIVQEGGTPLGFHLITEGEAVVEIAGKERRRLGPGDSFGLVSLLDGKPRSATVRAVTELTTIAVAPGTFRPLLDSDPQIARDLLPVLCAMLRDAERQPE